METELRTYGVELRWGGNIAEVELIAVSEEAARRRAWYAGLTCRWFDPEDEVRITATDEGPMERNRT